MFKHSKSMLVVIIGLIAVTVITGCNPPPRPGFHRPSFAPGFNKVEEAAKKADAKAKAKFESEK